MNMSVQSEMKSMTGSGRQRGAALIVGLLLLLVMTVLALGASQATRMQERMAGNTRDYDLAFQSAEAALRTAERLIDDPALTSAPFPCSSGRCRVFELNVVPDDAGYRPVSWWDANAWSYASGNTWNSTPGSRISGTGLISGTDLAGRDPQFVIEEVEEVSDSLTIPPTGPPPSRIFYRITSSAQGGTTTAQVVLQSTFARRFN
jgi:type IV pilus assembly protein PilX